MKVVYSDDSPSSEPVVAETNTAAKVINAVNPQDGHETTEYVIVEKPTTVNVVPNAVVPFSNLHFPLISPLKYLSLVNTIPDISDEKNDRSIVVKS